MNILGMIPARGGSKGIPRKNIVPLAGKPLLAYTCEVARLSTRLDRIILSTDDVVIASVGKEYGVEVPFIRPKELSGDDVPMVEVMRHAVREMAVIENYKADVLVLLQPTSPLKKPSNVDDAVKLLQKTGADCVVSVTCVPHQFLPSSLMLLDGERLVPLSEGSQILRRQEKERLFARNGPAVMAIRTEFLLKYDNVYGGDTRALVMNAENSLDIDGPDDLRIAEALFNI